MNIVPYLLSYPAVILFALLFLSCTILFILRRQYLSPLTRTILFLLILLCLAYFAFLLWLVVGFGRGPLHEPAPSPVSF